MADDTAALVIQLSADFRQFANQMRSATGVFKVALAGITAGAVVALVKKSLDAASAIGDAAKAAGLSAEKLQTLEFAAAQSGASIGDMDTALVRLNKTLGDAIQGQPAARQLFEQLGIDPAKVPRYRPGFRSDRRQASDLR